MVYQRGFQVTAAARPSGRIGQRGFSLFEVLITVIVISIGLLGMAGLQFAGLRSANNAEEHTLAVLLLQDIHARTHANQVVTYGGISLNGSSTGAGTVCNVGTLCNPVTMRTYDRDQWIQMIQQPLLPNLAINIEYATFPLPHYTATVTWGHSDNPQTLSASFAK